MLRLRCRSATPRFLKAGDPVRLDGDELGESGAALRHHHAGLSADRGRPGRGRRHGRRASATISSASASGSGSPPASAPAIVIPGSFVTTRFGLDYVRRLRQRTATRSTSRCSAARPAPRPDMPDGIEILSGLQRRRQAGAAMNLGLSGRLTQATIRSPLTPLFLLAALAVGPDRAADDPARGRAADQRADGRHHGAGRRPEGAGRGRAGHQAAGRRSSRAINGVEHVYSQTQDDRVMVTARFLVGTNEDDAILRVHEKIRANYRPHPGRHSRAADRRPRHQRRRRSWC